MTDSVCRPNGLKYTYHDARSGLRCSALRRKPSFMHLVKFTLPKSSPMSNTELGTFGLGPSSYKVIASHSACPPGVNVHEFLAFQNLLSGSHRRWVTLLLEMASANLNFSNETTMLLVTQVCLECGPLGEDKSDTLRATHSIFHDARFCNSILEQINTKLNSLVSNWRETFLMDTLITLLLRLAELTKTVAYGAGRNANPAAILDDDALRTARRRALESLAVAREICSNWGRVLRQEAFSTSETETAGRCQQYALWASLLCKRTFSIFVGHGETLEPENLQIYLECSMTVQENLVHKLETLPPAIQHAVKADFIQSYKLCTMIQHAILQDQACFLQAIHRIWQASDESESILSDLVVDRRTWVTGKINWGDQVQDVAYEVVEGVLLINRQTLGVCVQKPGP